MNITNEQRIRLAELLHEVSDAAFACGEWDKHESDETYEEVHAASDKAKTALLSEVFLMLAGAPEPPAPPPAPLPAMPEPHIVAFGSPADGFEYVGPFASCDDANEYADMWLGHEDWWVIMLQLPAGESSDPTETYRCKVCGEPSAGGFIDCCPSDDLPEPGEIRETGR